MAVKSKISELQRIIKVMGERQKWIRSEINKKYDSDYKNNIGVEHQDNSVALRIMYWMLWTLQGVPLKEKKRRDPKYLDWFVHYQFIRIRETLAEQLGMTRKDWWAEHKYYTDDYQLHSQKSVHFFIYSHLFPAPKSGIFGLPGEDDIENEVWRNFFEHQHDKEYTESISI